MKSVPLLDSLRSLHTHIHTRRQRQALYKSDWRNFMERIGISSEQQALSKKHIESTRLWASFRAQTLARTVEGIMYYEAALRQLASLEKVAEDKVSQMCMWHTVLRYVSFSNLSMFLVILAQLGSRYSAVNTVLLQSRRVTYHILKCFTRYRYSTV